MCSSRGIHRAILGLASTFLPPTSRCRGSKCPGSGLTAEVSDMPRGSLLEQKGLCAGHPSRAPHFFESTGWRSAFVGSTRSTRRIGSDINDVRLETIGRILSILSILLRQRRSGARRLNTMLGADRQAQRAEKLFGGSVWRSWSLWRSSFLERELHAVEDFVPRTHRGLPEEPQAGVPGGTVAVDHPPPVSGAAEGDPAVDGECAGQVGDCCLGSDDQVQEAHHGGCVEKVAARLEPGDRLIELGNGKLSIQRAQVARFPDPFAG